MSDLIPVMHLLTPLVAAAAAWHVYKLKKLENGGEKKKKTVVTAGRRECRCLFTFVYCCVYLASVARQQAAFPHHCHNVLAVEKH